MLIKTQGPQGVEPQSQGPELKTAALCAAAAVAVDAAVAAAVALCCC